MKAIFSKFKSFIKKHKVILWFSFSVLLFIFVLFRYVPSMLSIHTFPDNSVKEVLIDYVGDSFVLGASFTFAFYVFWEFYYYLKRKRKS